jgi:hypothetical protein
LNSYSSSGLLEWRGEQYRNPDDVAHIFRRSGGTAGGSPARWLGWILPAALASVLALIMLQACVASRPRSTQPRPAEAGRPPQRAVISPPVQHTGDDTITYILVGSQQQADLVRPLLQAGLPDLAGAPAAIPRQIITVAGSPEEEAQLRRTIEAANKQVLTYGEPGFRIVDLRTAADLHADVVGPASQEEFVLTRPR